MAQVELHSVRDTILDFSIISFVSLSIMNKYLNDHDADRGALDSIFTLM